MVDGQQTITLTSPSPDQETQTLFQHYQNAAKFQSLKEGDLLNNKYKIESILGTGAQGSVYVCTNIDLGNQWAVKHFNGSMNEKEILVKLNHVSLPKIADIFQDDKGSYIIESFIEGKSLDDLFKEREQFNEEEVTQWMVQLCEALQYVHSKNILHMDIKPKNILVTEDSRAILIDFGISAHKSEDKNESYKVYGYSPLFCSPEQEGGKGAVDIRSDLYSLGATIYYLLTKHSPKQAKKIREYCPYLSTEFSGIIEKSVQSDKDLRFETVASLKEALLGLQKSKIDRLRRKTRNRVLSIAAVPFALLICVVMLYVYLQVQKERTSMITVNTSFVTLSEQQLQPLLIEQTYKNGKTRALPFEKIDWTSENNAVALVEKGMIKGVNEGTALIEGTYYNQVFYITVRVEEGVKGVDISLKYNMDYLTKIYGGNQLRDVVDGTLTTASFMEPSSIAVTDEGVMYVVDRFLRKLENGQVTTIDTGYFEPKVIRTYGNDVYFATKEWINDEEQYVMGICQLVEEQPQQLLELESITQEFTDFRFDASGCIYAIISDYIESKSDVVKIDLAQGSFEQIIKGEDLLTGIVIDDARNIYVSQGGNNVIYKLQDGQLSYFAGAKYEKDFVDGQMCKFYEPRALTTDGVNLYVVDYNLIRKLTLEEGELVDTQTLSGNVEIDVEKPIYEGQSYEVMYMGGLAMDLIYEDGSLYVTDSKGNVVREIKKKED